jgi:hypothetical protein
MTKHPPSLGYGVASEWSELSTASLRPDWRLRAIVQRVDRAVPCSMPKRKAAKAALLLASPGGAADPPVRAPHLRRETPIDGNEKSVQATGLPL